MSRIATESLGTAAWRAGLSDPHLHWKRGKSAWEMAVSWEAKRDTHSGLPPEIVAAMTAHPAFLEPQLLVGLVEHCVMLDDPRRPSQNDLWAIVLTATGHVSMAVEGKAGEEFDKPLGEWLTGKTPSNDKSAGKQRRLDFLCSALALKARPAAELRYQLFHRTASAVIEAKRCRLPTALMMIQSFAESRSSWSDYAAFTQLFGVSAARQTIIGPWDACGTSLYFGWVDCRAADDTLAATAV